MQEGGLMHRNCIECGTGRYNTKLRAKVYKLCEKIMRWCDSNRHKEGERK